MIWMALVGLAMSGAVQISAPCVHFPPGSLSRIECERIVRQIEQPKIRRPPVPAPPIERSCEDARRQMRWSDLPCARTPEKGK
jgi:hypothetical protein